MSNLTLAAIQKVSPEVTLYQLESGDRYYAFLGEAELSEDRLHDLFYNTPEDGWVKHHQLNWFPLVSAETPEQAMINLETTFQFVRCEDVLKYVDVILTHSQYINDNFNADLKDTLQEAWDEIQGLRKSLHSRFL